MAQQTLPLIPENSALYLGILNSLRSWNFFDKPDGVEAYANTGGFGIDGGISSLAGAALASPEKLFFGITGDLAFFYDMNIFGNRHFASNIRLLLINNGVQELQPSGGAFWGEGRCVYGGWQGEKAYKESAWRERSPDGKRFDKEKVKCTPGISQNQAQWDSGSTFH